MPAGRRPGPYCASNSPQQIDDGTMCRASSPSPAPVGVLAASSIAGPQTTSHRQRLPRQGLPTLRKGTQGKHVRWLQILLNRQEGAQPPLKEDGYFGPKTAAAVIKFQGFTSQSPDGVVGMRTWLRVLAPPEGQPPQSVTLKSVSIGSTGPPSVAEWTLRGRFEEVLRLAPNYMRPELAAQFRALITPLSASIIAGTLAAWAVSHAFGVGEVADIGVFAIGTIFLGVAAFKAGEDIGDCIITTLNAETQLDLERAADYLAQAVAILGIAAFLSLVARVGARFGRAAGVGEEEGAAASADTAAKPSVRPPKTRVADEPTELEPLPTRSGPQIRSDLGDEWLDKSGNPKWPPNNGATGPEKPVILKTGTLIDRYGGGGGSFASRPAASYAQRSLPYDPTSVPYQQYEVLKPLPAMEGESAPWFDQPGGAPQYRFDKSLRDLVDEGFLKPK
jgi:peptidoglycan hydrolase-like protein with peptidoglycan-binding domain